MSYFPMFYDLNNKKILIVGAGKIALHKLEKLLEFTKAITVVSKEFSADFELTAKNYNLDLIHKSYEPSDLMGFDIVIAAIDDIELQKTIYFDAKAKHILCNSVDNSAYCDFLFPSFFKRNKLVVAVSSSGVTPSLAKGLREHFESQIPDELDLFIDEVAAIRSTVPKGLERQQKLIALSKEFLKNHFTATSQN